jgi:hypothetical protein
MSKKNVEFDAHKVVKKEMPVAFKKTDGTPVKFKADKPVKVPVHVRFKANPKRGGK